MTEKLRVMGERVAQLESYKQLCERRIAELDPHQAFPLHLSHIGKRPQALEHADLMHTKLNDLQSQVHQVGDYKRRLQLADESLRRETLANEEQRAYI